MGLLGKLRLNIGNGGEADLGVNRVGGVINSKCRCFMIW
jgi:hypothetical protein